MCRVHISAMSAYNRNINYHELTINSFTMPNYEPMGEMGCITHCALCIVHCIPETLPTPYRVIISSYYLIYYADNAECADIFQDI